MLENEESQNISEDKLEKIKQEVMSTPSMMPQDFDQTVNGWIARLSLWGSFDIVYHDPILKRKDKLTKEQLIEKLSDQEMIETFGNWDIEELSVTKIEIKRSYEGMRGKQLTEKIIFSIDLKPEIKELMK